MNLSLYLNRSLIKKLLPILFLLLLLYAVLEVIILYVLFTSQVEGNLRKLTSRVQEDVILKNGSWDMNSYKADSQISDKDPLYIITSEGFIVERTKPIQGLLDLSRYSVIESYRTPQTLTTVTNERWRVFSEPLLAGDKAAGIIMVASYDPQERDLVEIDKHIQDIVARIRSNVIIKDDLIDTSKIDVRQIPFNISFQVVSRFNKVLLQNPNSNSVSNIPSFIDRSYIDNQLKGNEMKWIEDNITHEKYLTLTTPILDDKKSIAGILVVGESVNDTYWSIVKYALLNFFVNVLLIVTSVPIVNFYLRRIHRDSVVRNREKPPPKVITFMKKACKLLIDDQTIDIPYASFQYYFSDALFSKPKKKWEVDELLEIFGEDFGSEKWRKVYDTMVALDRKTSGLVGRLFIVKDKRYFINPQFLPVINYVNS